MPGAGLEPARPRGLRILSPLRLPISPPGRHAIRHPEHVSDEWRPGSELNRRRRLCRPLHDHSATWPRMHARAAIVALGPGKNKTPVHRGFEESGAGNETRTRDPDLGKVVLYQLSYSRA